MSLFQTLNRWKERKRTEGRIIKKKRKEKKMRRRKEDKERLKMWNGRIPREGAEVSLIKLSNIHLARENEIGICK